MSISTRLAEQLVLAEDREPIIKGLTPDSSEAFFLNALNQQIAVQHARETGQSYDSKALKETTAAYADSQHCYDSKYKEIHLRSTLLSWPDKTASEKKECIEEIKNDLSVRLPKSKKASSYDNTQENELKFPTSLDEKQLDLDTVLANTLKKDSFYNFTPESWEWLANQELNASFRQQLLQSLNDPTCPNLLNMIDQDMKENKTSFGSHPIHHLLTREQLDKLSDLNENLKSNSHFVKQYLSKMLPENDADEKTLSEFHENAWTFSETLLPVHNSTRQSIMFEALSYQRNHGFFDFDKFTEYLKLPFSQDRFPHIDRFAGEGKNSTYYCSCDDSKLIRDYLDEYFAQEQVTDIDRFKEYLADDYLNYVLACTKILRDKHGSPQESWFVMLREAIKSCKANPYYRRDLLDLFDAKALQQEVQLRWDVKNPSEFKTQGSVSLGLWVKNVDRLVVKIYKVNTRNYYRTNMREVDSTLNIDGLTPQKEVIKDYSGSGAYQLALREIKLPSLTNQRGVYIVEVLGNGHRNRALIRKGSLTYLSHNAPIGHLFRLFDENSQPVSGSIWLSGHTYTSDEITGLITVPYSASPSNQALIMTSEDGQFSAIQTFRRKKEDYTMAAGFYVDRESLLNKTESELAVRCNLYCNGHPTSLAQQAPNAKGVMSDIVSATLTITSTNNEGITNTSTVDKFKLFDEQESIHKFSVPDNLRNIAFTLSVTVRAATGNKQTLTHSDRFQVNEIDDSSRIDDLFLRFGQDGYSLALLGKAGEPLGNRHVRVHLSHRFVNDGQLPAYNLKTDPNGYIQLGQLPNITEISAHAIIGNAVGQWSLRNPWRTSYPSTIHGQEDIDVVIPFPQDVSALAAASQGDGDSNNTPNYSDNTLSSHFALHSVKQNGSVYLADLTSSNLKVDTKKNAIVLHGLSQGTYRLRIKKGTPTTIPILIAAGALVMDEYIMERNRFVRLNSGTSPSSSAAASSLQIVEAVLSDRDDHLNIQLAGYNAQTRVHVLATHFYPKADVLDKFNIDNSASNNLTLHSFSPARSTYQRMARLGDEHQYIIDRKTANKYVGNMLERPSLLLNKRVKSETSFSADPVLHQGESFAPMACMSRAAAAPGGPPRGGARHRSQRKRRSKKDAGPAYGPVLTDNIEFLHQQSTRSWNNKPNNSGIVSIPRNKLGQGHSYITVVAINRFGPPVARILGAEASYSGVVDDGDNNDNEETKSLSLNKHYRDTRLLPGLDSSKHFTEQYLISLLQTGDELVIKDIKTSQVESYQTLTDAYDLFKTLSSSSIQTLLNTFSFVLKWNSLREDEKNSKYSQFACHELNFFIYQKDRPYFDQVVVPYLRNKLHKTLLDLWFLADDLNDEKKAVGYLQAYQFNRLNALEQVLLASKTGRSGDVLRMLVDKSEMRKLSTQARVRLFKTALQSRALEKDKSLMPQEERMDRCMELEDADDDFDDYEECERVMNENKSMEGFGGFDGLAQMSQQRAPKALFQAPPTTKEYEERDYYNVSSSSNDSISSLIPPSAFWTDYAKYLSAQLDNKQSTAAFLSEHLIATTNSFTECMCVLAVLDLPFDKPEHSVSIDMKTNRFSFTAKQPAILFQKQVGTSEAVPSCISVSQNYFDPSEQRDENGADKYVENEFLRLRKYGCRVVLTNISSTQQEVEVLQQIPTGAMPVSKSNSRSDQGFSTQTTFETVSAFSTKVIEYWFYFPALGSFSHYPVHVSKMGQVVGHGQAQRVEVVDKRSTPPDLSSWSYVANYADNQLVYQYLKDNNMFKIDLAEMAWRCWDKSFFETVIPILKERFRYHSAIFAFGLVHYDSAVGQDVVAEYLAHQSKIIGRVGPYFKSPLVSLDSADRQFNLYQHLEYHPLINARAHQLRTGSGDGGLEAAEIQNVEFRQNYQKFLNYLLYRTPHIGAVPACHLLSLTYYLLLQDRVEDAKQVFARINPDQMKSDAKESDCEHQATLQYDYMTAYLDFFNPDGPQVALSIAKKYAQYPILEKRKLFEEIVQQVVESHPNAADDRSAEEGDTRDRKMADLAASEPALDFVIENKRIEITHQNCSSLVVNFYQMDLELMFSTNPFVSSQKQFLYVAPNRSRRIELEDNGDNKSAENTTSLDLPAALDNSNIYVEVVAEGTGLSRTETYFSHSLNVQVIENYGQLKVTRKRSPQPVAKAYVKVYARMDSGRTEFYKDGYTDRRGCFDYASLSTNKLPSVTRFAILVLSQDLGGVVREAAKPAM